MVRTYIHAVWERNSLPRAHIYTHQGSPIYASDESQRSDVMTYVCIEENCVRGRREREKRRRRRRRRELYKRQLVL